MHEFIDYYKKNKFLFIHLPKSAGTSIGKFLEIPKHGHISLEKYEQLIGSLEDYFIFTFVRHPIFRFLSAFNYLSYGGRNLGDEEWKNKLNISRNNYKNILKIIDENIDSGDIPHHFNLQSSYLKFNNNKKLIKKNINFIGKYENLNSDFKNLCVKLGVKYKPLEFENITKKSESNLLLKDLDKEDLKFLKKIYFEDFKNFYSEDLENNIFYFNNLFKYHKKYFPA